jgi:hypothetical protein
VVPLSLPPFLLIAQVVALIASVRKGIWRAAPAWVGYLCIATIHLIMGEMMAFGLGRTYPVALLYLEPLIIVGQIAFTFESTVKYLGTTARGGSPEGRLMLWLIPLVPSAIVLPIEIGFIKDALVGWSGDEAESLRLVYAVRMFLSITLLVILAMIPIAARVAGKVPQATVAFHHQILTAYLACSAIGYLCKSYVSVSADRIITVIFFIIGPLICFALWSRKMWNASPADLRPVRSEPISGDRIIPLERRGGQFQNL